MPDAPFIQGLKPNGAIFSLESFGHQTEISETNPILLLWDSPFLKLPISLPGGSLLFGSFCLLPGRLTFAYMPFTKPADSLLRKVSKTNPEVPFCYSTTQHPGKKKKRMCFFLTFFVRDLVDVSVFRRIRYLCTEHLSSLRGGCHVTSRVCKKGKAPMKTCGTCFCLVLLGTMLERAIVLQHA